MKEIDKILHLLNYADAVYSKATLTPEESKQLIDYINAKKAEIEKLKVDLIVWKQDRFNLYQRLELYKMAREKVAWEIFKEIEDVLNNIGYFDEIDFNALKKKYTEGERS